MKRLLAALTLIVVVILVLATGITIFGCLPLILFEDSIGDSIKTLSRAVVA